jgi:hypothetical protein
MTPHDHNKTLAMIYSLLGGLLLAAAIVEAIRVMTIKGEFAEMASDFQILIISGLLLLVILIPTAYGLFKRRRWARFSTLLLSGLLVFLFPLGTALAIYTWWFMHSEGGKLLYQRSAS